MNVSTLLRTAQTILSTSLVAVVGVSCLTMAHAETAAGTDGRVGVEQTAKEFRVAPARKEYRKEYRATGKPVAAPSRKEYRKEYRATGKPVAAPSRKEYRKEYRATGKPVAPHRAAALKLVSYTVASSPSDRYVARVLRLVNKARQRHHLHRLAGVGCAERRAVRWSRHLAATHTFRHQSMTRVMRACKARYAGETLGRGSVSARRLVRMWLDSTPHRRVLLGRTARRVGVGATKDVQGRWVVAADFVRL